jgi:CubicO group peptidase (beta-lactamase class C family)
VCLQCVERGELNLDEDINTYLPAASHTRNPHFPAVPITVRQLLTHRAGLNDGEEKLLVGEWRTEGADFGGPLSHYIQEVWVEGGRCFQPKLWNARQAPGEAAYHYSNGGFTLLGCTVEAATGQSLEKLARDRIFVPLGMASTSYCLAGLPESLHVAVPHTHGGEAIGHYGVAEWPAASIRSTVADLLKYLSSLATAGDERMLSEGSKRAMLPPDFRGGLAWWGVDTWYGDKEGGVWTHGGFMQGVRTHIYFWPATRSGAVILTNAEEDYSMLEEATKAGLAGVQPT